MGYEVYRVRPFRREGKEDIKGYPYEKAVNVASYAIEERRFVFGFIPWGWKFIGFNDEQEKALNVVRFLCGKRTVFVNRQGDIVEVVKD